MECGGRMKHKAQESKEIICNYADGNPSSSGQFVGMMLQKADDTLQDLINCQLTVDEMKFIANCLYVAGFVDENMVKQIFGKFQKQKEMWVSEE